MATHFYFEILVRFTSFEIIISLFQNLYSKNEWFNDYNMNYFVGDKKSINVLISTLPFKLSFFLKIMHRKFQLKYHHPKLADHICDHLLVAYDDIVSSAVYHNEKRIFRTKSKYDSLFLLTDFFSSWFLKHKLFLIKF